MDLNRLTRVCPHCQQGFHPKYKEVFLSDAHLGASGWFTVQWTTCPGKDCQKAIVYVSRTVGRGGSDCWMVFPRGVGRAALPTSVPALYADDFNEAAEVLHASPKASAALSRRVLQMLLREHLGIKARDLSIEIDQLLERKDLPSDIASDVDAIRHIGNFAAHPMKSTSTGQIVNVEPGEAEWLLTVLEELFDFYFVRTAARAARRDAFKEKLADVKPGVSLKEPPEE